MNMTKTKKSPSPQTQDVRSLGQLADEELVSLYHNDGDRQAFEVLVRRYERPIYSYLFRYLGHEEQARDAFQATFITVFQRLDQFESSRRFRPWLYAIATNKAIDLKRHLKRRAACSLDSASNEDEFSGRTSLGQSIESKEMDPVSSAMQSETVGRVRDVLGMMNQPTQELLEMVFYQGLKYADISEALDIPVGTVKSRVFNAIRKLNVLWQRTYPEKHDQ